MKGSADHERKRATDVFLSACDVEAEQRAAYLEIACGGDLTLRKRVEALLEADASSLNLESVAVREVQSAAADTLDQEFRPESGFMPGQVLGDRYRIVSPLGRGGMGEVWQAADLKLRVDVALKSMHPKLFASQDALELLRREVRLAREVISPNVCRIYDLVVEAGQELISMEYIDGQTLVELIAKRSPLDLHEAGAIASQFLAGLDAIHQAGLVHRDVKPENIMLTRSGRVVVMDFGIARAVAEHASAISGTPAYMAPEQARGEPVDGRADLFSAALVLAEMVAPEGIRDGKARQALWAAVRREPPELADTRWQPVLLRALAGDRESRYGSAPELARALEDVSLRVEGAEDKTPYPGLQSFTESEAEFFYGREAEAEALWTKLQRAQLLALIGPSGAGKSSFLRAGLLPVMPEGWNYVLCQPSASPFVQLAQALAPDLAGDAEAVRKLVNFEDLETAVSLLASWRARHKEALLIVDQFEELFTLNRPEVQSRFAELLGRAALEADVRVLLSLRDDFLFHCHEHAGLAPLFAELTPLGPPVGAALRRALVQPALRCGYRYEDEALVEEMLGELSGQRGALPLLAFAAARLWERRDREQGLLTREAYQEVGGVAGALAQHAEATLERIGQARRPLVREIFRNLVTAQGTRASLELEELLSVFEDREAGREIVKQLIDARLLTSFELPAPEGQASTQRVEIVHESLLKAWPRLVHWQTQDAEAAQLRDQLRQSAQLWNQREQPEDLLWTGTSYGEFQLWRERYPGGLTATEDAFAVAMAEQAGRRRRRRRVAVASAFVLLIAVLSIIAVLWRQSEDALVATEAARQLATSEARRAEAGQLVALGRLELDLYPTAALAHATRSLELSDQPSARRLVMEALWRGPPATILDFHKAFRAVFSPDGRWLVLSNVVGDETYTTAIAARDGGPLRTFDDVALHGRLAFDATSGYLVGRDADTRALQLFSAPGFEPYRMLSFESPTLFRLLQGPPRLLTFSSIEDGQAELVQSWAFPQGEARPIGKLAQRINILNFAPSVRSMVDRHFDIEAGGQWLALIKEDGLFLHALDRLAEPGIRAEGQYDTASGGALRFNPAGDQLAFGQMSGQVALWALSEGALRPLRTLQGPVFPSALAFDGEGARLACSSWSKSVTHVWDLDAPPAAAPLVLRRAEVIEIRDTAFDPSGRWLVTTDSYATALWPVDLPRPYVLRGPAALRGLVFSQDGRRLIATGLPPDGGVWSWPLTPEPGTSPNPVVRDGPIYFLVPHPDGTAAVAGDCCRIYKVPYDDGESEVIAEVPFFAHHVAVSPDGGLVAVSMHNGPAVTVVDIETGQEVQRIEPGPGKTTSGVAFLTNTELAYGLAGSLRVWRLDDGSSELLLEDPAGAVWILRASADGRTLVAASGDLDSEMRAVAIDMEDRTSRWLTSHGDDLNSVALDPTGSIVVLGHTDGTVSVGPLSGEAPHLLLGHEGRVWAVAVSADGRRIASGGDDGTVRLWRMPAGKPFHTLPGEELLARLAALTNVRVVEDPEAPTGYRLDTAPFPGWAEAPTW